MGLNLTSDKKCSFDCAYCQVDRSEPGIPNPPLAELLAELEAFLAAYTEAGQYEGMELKDLGLAGDGEPSLYPQLPALLTGIQELKEKYQITAPTVLFTNGSRIDRADLREIWTPYFAAGNQVWFKLDFWDQASFERSNGASGLKERVLEKLLRLGSQHPVTLQACFFKEADPAVLNPDFVQAWAEQLLKLLEQGLQVEKIQVYSLAREPKEKQLAPYTEAEMLEIGRLLQERIKLDLELYF